MKTRRKNRSLKAVIILSVFFLAFASRLAIAQEEPPEVKNYQSIAGWVNYPDSAKKNKIEGRVTIKLLVGLQGEVAKLGELTGPEIFYDEVKRVSIMLKFKPAKLNGKKVKCWVTVPFNFKLKPDDEEEK